MNRWQRCAAAALAIAVTTAGTASSVSAQYRAPQPPAVPPQPPSQPSPGTEDDKTEPKTPREPAALVSGVSSFLGSGWHKAVVVDVVHENNVGFLSPPGPNDYFGSLRGSLVRWHTSARNDLRIALAGGGYAYANLKDRNRLDGSALVRGSSRLSERVTGGFGADFSMGHADTEQKLTAQGILLPPVGTTSGQLTASVRNQLSRRTSLAFDGLWQRVLFDSVLFLDTTLWSGEAALRTSVSTRDTFGLRSRYARWSDSRSTHQNPAAGLEYARQLGARLTGDINLGAGRDEFVWVAEGVELPPAVWQFDGSAGLTGQIRRSTIALRYSHALRPTVGLGVSEISDLVQLDCVTPVGQRLELQAAGSFGSRRDPRTASAQRETFYDLYFGTTYRIGPNTRAALGYRLRSRSARVSETIADNNRLSLSLVWEPRRLGMQPAGVDTRRATASPGM